MQSRSVVLLLVDGWSFCSGTLINNTSNDGVPYILTAEHCVGDDDGSTWVYLFNFESPTCENEYPAIDTNTISGSTIRAKNAVSDFALFEMSAPPPSYYNTIYSGWSRSTTSPTRFIGISHPSGDIKKWNEESPKGKESGYWWTSPLLNSGQTEGGSSGCGVWDQNGRLVGQLNGGNGWCDDVDEINYWGRFDKSWEGGGSANTRLKDWLDPTDTDEIFIDYFDPNADLTELIFQVDLSKTTDLYDSGFVRISFGYMDSLEVMTDTSGNGIYSVKVSAEPGTDLKYFFFYQNGTDTINDYVDERSSLIGTECGDTEGYRTLKIPVDNQTLPAVFYGTCHVTLVKVTDITVMAVGGSATVEVGSTLRMKESVAPDDATDKSVTWSVDDPAIATIDAVTGLLSGVKAGLVKVTASANDTSGVSGTLDVTVEPSPYADITFQVDLSEISNFYDGGDVWVGYGNWEDWDTMTDPDGDSIYSVTARFEKGMELKYMFGYQTGSNPNVNYVDERNRLKGAECATVNGYRTLTIPDRALTLAAVIYGTCDLVEEVSVIDRGDENKVNIYYNSVGDFVTITNSIDVEMVEIYSLTGQLFIKQKTNNQSSLEISTNTLPKGFYLVRLKLGSNKIQGAKFVK